MEPGRDGGERADAAPRRRWSTATPEVGILPTGQVVGVIEELPTVAELVQRIVDEAEATLTRLGA